MSLGIDTPMPVLLTLGCDPQFIWPVDADKAEPLARTHASRSDLWVQPGVARNDDNEPHYAVPLVGTTEERLATIETLLDRARHVFRVNEYIRSGRIY